MVKSENYTINTRGTLLDLSLPCVMGIVNVTPDSFYAASRQQTDADIARRADEIIEQGGSIIDLGAYSTRPGAKEVSAEEEMERLARALHIIRSQHPDVVISIDTFRAFVAERCVKDFEADIINDVSGGEWDKDMFETMERLRVPYVLTHNGVQRSAFSAQCAASGARCSDHVDIAGDVLRDLGKKVDMLHEMGVNDIILDPGYGFGKTMEQNYELFRNQHVLHELGLPLLVGVSRKSMIYKLLGTTPEDALNGSTVLHTVALMQGANILRVHDVKEAMEAIRLVEAIQNRGNKR